MLAANTAWREQTSSIASPPHPPLSPHGYACLCAWSSESVCWNIDASRNREFFDRNLSQAGDLGRQLAYQVSRSWRAIQQPTQLPTYGLHNNLIDPNPTNPTT